MKLQDRLPRSVTVNGKKYRMNFDFRRVLRMLEVLDRDELLPGAKNYLALKCVMRFPRGNLNALLSAVMACLFPDAKAGNNEKITDYVQDAAMIRAAFLQSYGINLYKPVKLHWLTFRELLFNLPEGSRYTNTLSIRARPLPQPTQYNQAERDWLIRAKEACALKISEDEKRRIYQDGVHAVFAGMLALSGGVNHGG